MKSFLPHSVKIFINVFLTIILFNGGLTAYADLSFRKHRFNSFHVLPPNQEGDIVFIGNSITNMMNWNELFGNRTNIKNRGVSGAYTYEILENLESMISGNPTKIFLMAGTNDLGMEGDFYTPERVAYRIEKIISRIRKKLPETEIYYQSILPSKVGLRNEEKITSVNKMIEEWIKNLRDDKIVYLDLYSTFVENGELKRSSSSLDSDNLSYDGLHLTQEGYKIWADLIKELIGYIPSIHENSINLWGGLTGSNGMRVTYFGAFPVEENDVLIIGDEMIHGGEWNELMKTSDFKDRGIGWGFPGLTIENIKSVLEIILKENQDYPISRRNPKAIVVYAGTRDILEGENTDIILSKYRDLIEELKRISPSSNLFLMTILSPGEVYKNYETTIEEFNKTLPELSEKYDNVSIIDINSLLKEGEKRNELMFTGSDSPYLSGAGYSKIAETIAQSLNKELGTAYNPLSYEEAINNLIRYREFAEKNNDSYIVFDNSVSEVPYRIPAIAMNKNGDLIAVADYRYSKADIGMVENGKLDLRFRIKDAATGKWGNVETLASAFGEGDSNVAFGDPCIVADRESNLVMVLSCCGNVSFPKGTYENHQGVARFYSEDGGKTWTEYEDIGDRFLNLLEGRKDGKVCSFFIGSGKISQSNKIKNGDYYRIYCSTLVRVNDGKTKVNYVFYSDDFGKTWNLLGDVNDCPIPSGADEPKTEELPDGSVLVSSRISGGRYYNIFRYTDENKGEGKWDEPAISDISVNGIKASSNACNGETLLIPVVRNSDGRETFLLLQSVPMDGNGKRSNVGINYKDLSSLKDSFTSSELAKDWDGYFEVTPNSSAYSTMVLDKDNDIAFFYEENAHNMGYDMVWCKLSIEEITNGNYSFLENSSDSSPVKK